MIELLVIFRLGLFSTGKTVVFILILKQNQFGAINAVSFDMNFAYYEYIPGNFEKSNSTCAHRYISRVKFNVKPDTWQRALKLANITVFQAEHYGPSMFFRHLSTFQKRPLSRMAALSPERRHLYLMRGLHLVFLFAHEKHLCHIEFGTLWEKCGYEYKLFMFVRFCPIFFFFLYLDAQVRVLSNDVKYTMTISSLILLLLACVLLFF